MYVPDSMKVCVSGFKGVCVPDSKGVCVSDSKGNPRSTTNSKGKKRKPNSKDLSAVLKTNDALFLDFIKR